MYRAQELIGAQKLQIVEKNKPQELDKESVLLKVAKAGICGSDLEYYKHGYCGKFVPKGPLVLGHEFCGTVDVRGSGVNKLNVGDKVAVDPSIPCRFCLYCISGRYNLCENMKFFGSASCNPHIQGGFAEYVEVPAQNCFKVDKDMDPTELALVEPFSVATAAVKKIENITSCNVLLFGGGAIGQLIIKALRYFGAQSITLIDPRSEVEQIALENGADKVFVPRKLEKGIFHVCIDASGVTAAIAQAYEYVAKGGQVIQVGTSEEKAILPINLIMSKELVVKGSFRFAHVFEMALELLLKKRVSLANLVSHTIDLDELKTGFEMLLDPKKHTCKIHVNY